MSQHVAQLRAWADAQAKTIVDTASASALGGDANWDAIMAAWKVTPLSPADRQRHVTQGPQRPVGAAPIEVRWALRAVAAAVKTAADDAEARGVSSEEEASLDRLRHGLDGFVEDQLRAYVAATRPKITTSSIFANAAATSRNMTAAGVQAGASTLQCPCCGAPRLDATKGRDCEFCGSRF